MVDRDAAERAVKEANPIIDGRKANVNLAYLGAKPRANAHNGAALSASVEGEVVAARGVAAEANSRRRCRLAGHETEENRLLLLLPTIPKGHPLSSYSLHEGGEASEKPVRGGKGAAVDGRNRRCRLPCLPKDRCPCAFCSGGPPENNA
ncbi:hypothetical protein HPB48_001133 [Haemaphysalis longicornis]|uniref:RNA-binding protein 38 n=1 Tax=Haemaphysalis longicornis TaxID=44386 RepID=A0A9J6GEU1_HAELO|nr:hypothetical protein HPB48_001133 [Haemaphysalis longicornis]